MRMTTKTKPDPSAALVAKLTRQLQIADTELREARELLLIQREKIERLERRVARLEGGKHGTAND